MAEVLFIPNSHEGQTYFSSTHLDQPSSPPTFQLHANEKSSLSFDQSYSVASSSCSSSTTEASSDTSSPLQTATNSTRRSSLRSTPRSSISFDTNCYVEESSDRAGHGNGEDEDEDNFLPSYEAIPQIPLERFSSQIQESDSLDELTETYDETDSSVNDSISESTPTLDSDLAPFAYNPVADDTFIRDEPTRQVDYLSHDWREEDIWYSWRHITSRRRVYGERSRLENASWRTWAKSKYKLKTVPPESLNWLKDCDVTWLYGPLQQAPTPRPMSEPQSTISKNNSFVNKKPCLKKRSVSEVMLQKSLSSSSLLKQAAAVVQAQRRSPTKGSIEHKSKFRRGSYLEEADPNNTIPLTTANNSSPESGLHTPDNCEKRHIRFHDTVKQCIAVDFSTSDEFESDQRTNHSGPPKDSDESSEDDVIMMKSRSRRHPNTPSSRRSSLSQESSTGIAMLPSTTLKFHHDESPQVSCSESLLADLWQTPSLHSSASQETLRPTHPKENFFAGSEHDHTSDPNTRNNHELDNDSDINNDNDDDDGNDTEMHWEPSGAFGQTSISKSISNQSSTLKHSKMANDAEISSDLRRTPSGMFMPFDSDEEEDSQNKLASSSVFGKVVDTVNTARDIAHVIWNVGWRQ